MLEIRNRNEELGIKFEDRVEIEIKGKRMMKTWFIESEIF